MNHLGSHVLKRLGSHVLKRCLVALLVVGSCSEGGTLPSPIVRVDLRDRLPQKVLQRLLAADTSYSCTRVLSVEERGAGQRFNVAYRVFAFDEQTRYITAVDVEPVGAFHGGRGPEASALVGEPVTRGAVTTVPLQIRWSAQSGCSALEGHARLELSTAAPGCAPPQLKRKIFSADK